MQIPDYYEFLNHSKIISGKCSLENIPSELDGYDVQKPLVITGKNVVERRLVKKFIKAFFDSTVPLGGIFDDVRDYAGITLAQNAAFLYKERGCDSIIALGNGPVVDVAKATNVLVSEKTGNLSAYYKNASALGRLKPLIHVPVCRSNGMEATNIMTLDNRRIVSDNLYPDVVVIDPRMTPGCCRECAAESAMIALAHAFTAMIDDDHNPMNDAVAHASLSFISGNLAKGAKRPKNKNASMALANASVMAASAYANTRPGMAHLLADELSAATGISAGKFIYALIPPVVGMLHQKKTKTGSGLLLAIAGMDAYAAVPERERPQKGLEAVLKLVGTLKGTLPDSLKALNVQKYKLAEVAAAAASKSGKRFTDADCRAVLEKAWDHAAG